MKSLVLDENSLHQLCETLDLKNQRGIYLLKGDLASGKTTLVKAMVQYLGNSSVVTSPTFLLAQDYGEGIYHYDIYQKNLEELLEIGFLEELEKEGWHFIEWGDEKLAKILKQIGMDFKSIEILPKQHLREYRIDA
ncbi:MULTISPECIES: tRNA (adenosine(37)-N6)-threonylcarbamoyltransferase complex ATPase subunit type 1 TsaE [Helicobacter]|uniref:tRNA threonylcarbamoyladenosine biosynthesis protein TsaE n=1 Tax=Helicobacter colisuis TaxID=2949739 RepID=A0ABT0TUV9_9HELI|nr:MULTISPECIES: tRNA (adenosine(37)-N6)-threonylcarbamoyltransferase complex ATPase subunit type 1 TsaE [Helicobacter]MCI2235595.1 tRNA (adenosine(37)-N6)-threonylcarbamoyltransferase complex ATPase subunit type 1 TsaE [Helicobacter sp. CaF467b]MCI7047626.1 tRNA (adenosine(37)-N6)-threonylcarbamoyltransferase complex ATPase subunit type 1 TsaE [Helicobacter sp.]MCI7766060.1 tRNA (adenosine(37)-N6)-threonylcarbamoyltransferase complex ATPase subunit type 1 TsaE [Helicobacter sp.]MCL9819584.1 tR